jgi:hypothetical protein
MGSEGQGGRFNHPVAGSRMPFGQAQRRLNPFWAHPTSKNNTKKPLDDPPEY